MLNGRATRAVVGLLVPAVCWATLAFAQARPAAAPRRASVDQRPPLDPSRSVYLDAQSGAAAALTPIRATLRDAKLWTIQNRRDNADLVLTIRPAPHGFEMTVQSTRAASAAPPLWHAAASTPAALAKQLKADLAPSVCVVVWCR